jgi:hypothetical protein
MGLDMPSLPEARIGGPRRASSPAIRPGGILWAKPTLTCPPPFDIAAGGRPGLPAPTRLVRADPAPSGILWVEPTRKGPCPRVPAPLRARETRPDRR